MYQEQFLIKSKWIVLIMIFTLVIINKYKDKDKNIKFYNYFILIISFILFYILFTINQQPIIPKLKTNEILSPSSGYIGDIKYLKDKTIIMFNLSFFSNHIQYIPYNGRVISDKYIQSKLLRNKRMFLFHPKIFPNFDESIEKNEKYHTILETAIGNIEITRIAGLVAPRVHTLITNENVKQGDVMGIIIFSSMVLLTIPSSVKLYIKKGDTLNAGESIIGYI